MNKRTYRIALGGMLSALAATFMFLGGVFPFAEYIGPAAASLCVLIFRAEFNIRSSLVMYIAVSLVSLILSSNLESSLLFLCLLGWYPILKEPLERKTKTPVTLLIIFSIVNISVLSLYYFLLHVLKLPSLEEELSGGKWITVSLILMYNLTFLFYDKLLSMVDLYYRRVLRDKLIR